MKTQPAENTRTEHSDRKHPAEPSPRPAGEQAIGPELYQQIRRAVRELSPPGQ